MPLLIVAVGVLFLLALIIAKVKPLYALLATSCAIGLAEGLGLRATVMAMSAGIFDVVITTMPVLLLGALFGSLIAASGAAVRITEFFTHLFGKKNLSWGIMITGLIVGLPLFYNAGFVILVPLVFSMAAAADVPLLWVGLPMAASLSVTHGFLPPHPAPTAIAQQFNASPGQVLVYGLVIALPAASLAGPLLANWLKHIRTEGKLTSPSSPPALLPDTWKSFAIALLPVVVIALPTFLQANGIKGDVLWIKIFKQPAVALGVAVAVAAITFRRQLSFSPSSLSALVAKPLREILPIILIIAASGGFKQVLVDSGVSTYIKAIVPGIHLSPLLFAWALAALLRVSMGSATVAALTAAGIVLPLVGGPGARPDLMVLAVGAGSLFCSHVNDTGFWMFKEYFNLSIKQTFLSWTLMESIVSLVGLGGVLLLNNFIT